MSAPEPIHVDARAAQTDFRFRFLVDSVTDTALFTTDHEGRITSWNSGANRMLGYSESEILGQDISRLFTTEDIRNNSPEKQRSKAFQAGRTEDEGWRVRKDGSHFWAHTVITAKEVGSQRGFAVVMQDYTVRRKTAIDLDNVRQERMNLQEQFLSHVSHELRTPLTAVYFFITNLLEGVVGNVSSAQRETLEFSLENIKQLQQMVSDLLDVSRVDTLKLTVDPQHMIVPALVAEVLRTCRANAKLKNINLLADLAPGLPAAWADRVRARQVLINLVDNAIRFTPDHGTVVVQGRIWTEDSGFLCLSVVDTGCGISPENCLIVFDRLAQVKSLTESARKGLGLGLFIAKELVLRQGGRIWVESQPEQGSTFSFTLPVFSLAKFCDPILAPAQLGGGCLTLLSIDAPAPDKNAPQDLTMLRRALERYLVAGQESLLPPMTETMTATGTEEIFSIVAYSRAGGAEAITKRVRHELELFYQSSERKPAVTAVAIPLSPNDGPWEKRKAETMAASNN
jgi:PAS domain S-box-containing protein